MRILNLVLLSTFLILTLGCGKKVNDPGPQFDIKATELSASESDSPNFVITRKDENSGPQITVDPTATIESVDKQLVCGPLTLPSRKASKNDKWFLTFKVSEAEFHGLNQLPLHPKCVLQITATNGQGSTATRNIPLTLNFDSHPDLKISRLFLTPGTMPGRREIAFESYVISNPLPYDVSFLINPTGSAVLWGCYSVQPSCAYYTHTSATLTPSQLRIDPKDGEISGSLGMGLQFKIKSGHSTKVSYVAPVPPDWTQTKKANGNVYQLTSILVWKTAVASESLLLSSNFENNFQSFTNGHVPTFESSRPFSDIGIYDPNFDPSNLPESLRPF